MNELIKQQLDKCKVAKIPPYTDDDEKIVILKDSSITVSPYLVHKFFVVEIADYIINPPETFSLAENWNKGSKPRHTHYKCEIVSVMGNMVKISGCGYNIDTDTDYNDVWEGWVPTAGIKLLSELR